MSTLPACSFLMVLSSSAQVLACLKSDSSTTLLNSPYEYGGLSVGGVSELLCLRFVFLWKANGRKRDWVRWGWKISRGRTRGSVQTVGYAKKDKRHIPAEMWWEKFSSNSKKMISGFWRQTQISSERGLMCIVLSLDLHTVHCFSYTFWVRTQFLL